MTLRASVPMSDRKQFQYSEVLVSFLRNQKVCSSSNCTIVWSAMFSRLARGSILSPEENGNTISVKPVHFCLSLCPDHINYIDIVISSLVTYICLCVYHKYSLILIPKQMHYTYRLDFSKNNYH